MKKFILVSAVCVLANCDFERDLAECTNAGRCTNSTGGGIGFPGGGTGITGGGTGITGGGTGITGGGTAVTGGGTGSTGGGPRTDCPTVELSREQPVYYAYYNPGAVEWTHAEQSGPGNQNIEFIVYWTSGGAATNVAMPVVDRPLDGGTPDFIDFRLTVNGTHYSARLGTISAEADRSDVGAVSAIITNGYFYDITNTDSCLFVPSLSIRTTNPHCTEVPSDAFSSNPAIYYNLPAFEYVTEYSLNQQALVYGIAVQSNWRFNGLETGAQSTTDSGYRFQFDNTDEQYFSFLNLNLPDGGSPAFRASQGTLNAVNITRGDAGVFQAELEDIEFYGVSRSIYSECYSLRHQYFDAGFP